MDRMDRIDISDSILTPLGLSKALHTTKSKDRSNTVHPLSTSGNGTIVSYIKIHQAPRLFIFSRPSVKHHMVQKHCDDELYCTLLYVAD